MYFSSPYFHHSVSRYPMFLGVIHPHADAFHDGECISSDTTKQNESKLLTKKAKRSITYHTVESDSEYKLLLDLPGVKVSDVTVNVEKPNTVTVHASRKLKDNEQITFEQKFWIDKIADTSNAKSTLENGVLTVQIAKVKPADPTIIEVKTTTDTDVDNDSKMETGQFMWTHDLPGVKSSDVKVTYHNEHVSILATRKRGDNIVKIFKKVSMQEDKYNVQDIKAFLVDGVLTITAPVLVHKIKSNTIEDGKEKVTTIPVLTPTATDPSGDTL